MATMEALREALAVNLAGIPGLQQSAYMLGNPTPPCAEVMPATIDYDVTMHRGLDRWNFTVRVYVGATTDIGAQKRLDLMLDSAGTYSVKAAVESDRKLGGDAADLRVKTCSGYRIYERQGGGALLGAEWNVEVLARGDT